MEPKLEVVQQKALASLPPVRTPSVRAALLRSPFLRSIEAARQRRPTTGLREMLLSLRWHLAGMSVAWMLVALSNIDHSPSPVATVARERIPSPQQLLAAIRENPRQLLELMELPVAEPAPAPSIGIPQRRGELQSERGVA